MDDLASASGTPKNGKSKVSVDRCKGPPIFTYLYLAVEASGSPESWVDGVWSIRGGNHDDSGSIARIILHTIHQRQQGRNNALFNLPSRSIFAFRAQGVYLVQNDDARAFGAGFGEDSP